MSAAPTWLQTHLEAIGRANTDGVGRSLRTGRCHRCQAVVARGLDDDWCAFAVTVDVTELDALGEFLAVVSGRRTFTVRHEARRLVLDRREAVHIARSPRDAHVVAEHRCGQPLPAASSPPPVTARAGSF